MTDGQEMLNELNYNDQIKKKADRDLLEWMAQQVYEQRKEISDIHQLCPQHAQRINELEARDKKMFGVTGGIGGLFGALLYWLINLLIKRG